VRVDATGQATEQRVTLQPLQDPSLPGSKFAVTLITMATALIGAVLFVGGLVLFASVFVMVSMAALFAVFIRGAAQAFTPRSAERHVEQRRSHHAAVIDTTARQSSLHSD
jgi:ABC-type Na+ efflux pump permease subunit